MWPVLRNLWPFSEFSRDELKASDSIVKKLPIPESTKHFVYAIREPDSQAVIYVLSVQNLSERSAWDAECLIREIKPDAVVVQVGTLDNPETSEGFLKDYIKGDKTDPSVYEKSVPTSVFEVLKKCFMHKINGEKFEDVAGNLVLKEIFGVSFNGHLISAKKAAEEAGSSFLTLESPLAKCSSTEDSECEVSTGVLGRMGNANASAIQSQMLKLLSSNLVRLNRTPSSTGEVMKPESDYEVPKFAKSIYQLLVDLHDMFVEIPSMRTALACAQKMLCDINKGEPVDSRILSEVYAFQIAVEGLRIAMNNEGRVVKDSAPSQSEFCNLSMEEKSHAILAQALRSQTQKYKSIVAVVDASGLSGLRRHWKTDLPPDIKSMVQQLVTNLEDGFSEHDSNNKKRLLADKPMVAVGAGATAILGASSLSKVVPASTFIKIATLHVPASLKLLATHSQRALVIAFGKGIGPTSKVIAFGKGIGPTSKVMVGPTKAALSAEKIRMVAHSVIASVEKTSFSAMRTAFYEIMRKRQVRPIGVMPFATFGCSVATCAGLLVYGDGIECAVESFPAARSIASLGRGIESLREASMVVRPAESFRIQKAIELLLIKCKNRKLQ